MSDTTVTVTAHMIAKEGYEGVLKQELTALIEPTRAEAGCIIYELFQNPENARIFMFYENWESKDDLDEHLQKPYVQDFFKKSMELLAEPLAVQLWESIPEG